MSRTLLAVAGSALVLGSAAAAGAAMSVSGGTGNADGTMAVLSRPATGSLDEHEAADDLLFSNETLLDHITFTGLVVNGGATPSFGQVVVEVYRVFPNDSTNPPSGKVPTRVNSPGDNALDDRDSTKGNLTYTTAVLNTSFSVANTVTTGIHPSPGETTGGDGPATGQEVQFTADFSTPFDLPAGHYFIVPQVETVGAGSEFLWLSAPRPIASPGTPFTGDLQMWVRNSALDPDWLRVGTDIVGPVNGVTPTFNGTFSFSGTAVPLPAAWKIAGPALLLMAGGMFLRLRRGRMA